MTESEAKILETLSSKVTLLSGAQILSHWPGTDLTGLIQAGYVLMQRVLAHPLLDTSSPVLCWTPGEPTPAFSTLAYKLQRRWSRREQSYEIYVATSKATNVVGGRAVLPKRDHIDHDLHVAQVYLQLEHERPELAAGWTREDILEEETWGEAVVDAMIRDELGSDVRAIEFVGRSYGRDRLERIHHTCAYRELPYELW